MEKLGSRFDECFDGIYAGDPVILETKKAPGGEVGDELTDILDFLEQRGLAFSFLFGGVHSLLQGVNKFVLEYTEGSDGAGMMDPDARLKVFRSVWRELPLERRTGAVVLGQAHKMGVILPILTVLGRITPAEYANAVLVMHLPHQKQRLSGPGWHDLLNETRCVRTCFPDWGRPEESFSTIREQVNQVLEYIAFFDKSDPQNGGVRDLIKTGEGFSLEFKSTLRWESQGRKKGSEHRARQP